eukprot:869643-Pleurochrysis_carterae.AAC.3
MHQQGTSDVGFIASKDEFPTALRSYSVRNYGCDFAGGALYSDNEIVLSSDKLRVRAVAEPDQALHAHAARAHARHARAWQRRRGVLGVLHDASQPDLQRDAPPLGGCCRQHADPA